ncbi:hypothetical protein D3C71_1638100 [compost metagenome]
MPRLKLISETASWLFGRFISFKMSAKPIPWIRPKTKVSTHRRLTSFRTILSTATKQMLSAIAGSTMLEGILIMPRTVSVSVMLCATVNAVIMAAYWLNLCLAMSRENRNSR